MREQRSWLWRYSAANLQLALSVPQEDPRGETHREPKSRSRGCNNFVEQRKHRSMTPGVVDVHECGAAVQRTHSLDGKIVRSSVIIGDLVSRRNQCA